MLHCRMPAPTRGRAGSLTIRPGIDHEGEVTGGSRQHANAVEAVRSSLGHGQAQLHPPHTGQPLHLRCVRQPSQPTVTAGPSWWATTTATARAEVVDMAELPGRLRPPHHQQPGASK